MTFINPPIELNKDPIFKKDLSYSIVKGDLLKYTAQNSVSVNLPNSATSLKSALSSVVIFTIVLSA